MGARNNTHVFPFFSGNVKITFILHSIFICAKHVKWRKLKPIALLHTVYIGINCVIFLRLFACFSFALAPVFILNFSFARRASPGVVTATANPANRFYANITLFLFPPSIWRETPRRPFNVHFLMIVRSERPLEIRECATPSVPAAHVVPPSIVFPLKNSVARALTTISTAPTKLT